MNLLRTRLVGSNEGSFKSFESKLKLVCPQMPFTAVITEHGVSLNDASVTLMLVRRFESRDSRDSDSQII